MLRRILPITLAGAGVLALAACFTTEKGDAAATADGRLGEVTVLIPSARLDGLGASAALAKRSIQGKPSLKLTVTGAGMDTLRKEWPLGLQPDTAVIQVPAGASRTFAGVLFDSAGAITHEGLALANVKAKQKTRIYLGLQQVRGQVAVCLDIEGQSKNCPDTNPPADSIVKRLPGFEGVKIRTLLTSASQLPLSPDFVYGSMADGNGLLPDKEGGYWLINNIEADYAVARIHLDRDLNPIQGDYILNADATANTAQCSGTLVTPEIHGFGPLYLSGGEWGGSMNGVFATDPFRKAADAGTARFLGNSMGRWSVENAVPLHKDAYPGKSVIFIGDDHSDNAVPSGQLGMYVGAQGDLDNGKLYGLRVTSTGINYEMDMKEGVTYDMEFVELKERGLGELDAECKAKGVMGFSRLEDIDWRRGSTPAHHREIYFCVTGRKGAALAGKGTFYGRVYKAVLNANDPTQAGKIECVLDGDILDGKAKAFHSPDNIVVTENYAYIQEDPNGYPDTPDKSHFPRVYQYNLNTGALKPVFEANQAAAAAMGYGKTSSLWEFTGMADVSNETGMPGSFLLITQNHGWVKADGTPFTDPKANPNLATSEKEGSMLFLVQGLER